jgi:hypothetical protein
MNSPPGDTNGSSSKKHLQQLPQRPHQLRSPPSEDNSDAESFSRTRGDDDEESSGLDSPAPELNNGAEDHGQISGGTEAVEDDNLALSSRVGTPSIQVCIATEVLIYHARNRPF